VVIVPLLAFGKKLFSFPFSCYREMSLTEKQITVLVSIRDEWNRAERDVKIAEQVCNEIVFPSINELRYGGRRVIEVVHAVVTGAGDEVVDGLLADAKFDCLRARHDAIDTAAAKIAITMESMIDSLKYEAILPAFPEFPLLVKQLGDVRKRIAESRQARENRDALYTAIELDVFPDLVERYQRLLECEPIMRKLALRSRWRDVIAILALVIGIAALIVAFI
jgi:hypothetical protein